jgi:hypothetical protein
MRDGADQSWVEQNSSLCLFASIRWLRDVERFNRQVEKGEIDSGKIKLWTIVPKAKEKLYDIHIDKRLILMLAINCGYLPSHDTFKIKHPTEKDQNGHPRLRSINEATVGTSGISSFLFDQMFYRDYRQATKDNQNHPRLPIYGDQSPIIKSREGEMSLAPLLPVPSDLPIVITPVSEDCEHFHPFVRDNAFIVNGEVIRVTPNDEPASKPRVNEIPRDYMSADGARIKILYDVLAAATDESDFDEKQKDTKRVGPRFGSAVLRKIEEDIADSQEPDLLIDPPVENETPQDKQRRQRRNKQRRHRRNRREFRKKQATGKSHFDLLVHFCGTS